MAKINIFEIRQSRDSWNDVNVDAMSQDIKEKFVSRKKAVNLYLDGLSLAQITEQTGISGSEVIRLTKRCILTDKNGYQKGYAALIPNKQVTRNNGVLSQLFLEHPTLEPFVIGNYFGDKRYTLEHNMNIRTLHTRFIEECKRLGVQDYDYPFTVKDKGYAVLYKYIKQKELDLQNKTIKRESKDSKQKFTSTGFGNSVNLNAIAPYNIVQIDGHKIDLLYTVDVENEQGEIISMPATRCWLLAIIDTSTRAIIGYSVSPHENYNQYDVLQTIHNSIVPHRKMEFTHSSFSYPDNGGFPSLALPETEWAVFDMIMLDNAKSHLTENVIYKVAEELKCTVNFGSVATPETRGIVERFFKTLEIQGFHRLPGTTGSNPRDTKRNQPEKESVKYRITYTDICELLEYLIAQYNNSAHSSLENETPLQSLERKIRYAGMQPYVIPAVQRPNIDKLTYFTEERVLRGGYKTGTKPHVSYNGTKYHAYDIAIPMDYIGQKVYLEINPADVSHVDLYDKDGVFIANLIATGEWGRRSHSLKTHQAALKRKNKNLETNTIFTPNLSEYEQELRENAKDNRRDRTKAAIVRKELGVELGQKDEPKQPVAFHKPKNSERKSDYSKEEMDLIDSMSIEEAYKKGLI